MRIAATATGRTAALRLLVTLALLAEPLGRLASESKGDNVDHRHGCGVPLPTKQKYPSGTPFGALPTFVHGDDLHFEHALRAAMLVADRVDILSAFLQKSGIDVLFAELTTTSGDSRLAR